MMVESSSSLLTCSKGIGLGLIVSNIIVWQTECSPSKYRGLLVASSLSFLLVGQVGPPLILSTLTSPLLPLPPLVSVIVQDPPADWRSGPRILARVWHGLHHEQRLLPFPHVSTSNTHPHKRKDTANAPHRAFQAVLGIATGVMLFFMPESPRYLFAKEKRDEAIEVFRLLNTHNGVVDEEIVNKTVSDIAEAIALESQQAGWMELVYGDNIGSRRRVLLACLINACQAW